MAFDGEYEFVPLEPVTHNAIPDAMKDFISQCGMMGVLPRNNFIEQVERENAQVIDLKLQREVMSEEEDLEDDVEAYIDQYIKSEMESKKHDKNKRNENKVEKSNETNEGDKVESVFRKIENNNTGVLKFLEVNGMPHEKAKKFIKRIVRLALRYNE